MHSDAKLGGYAPGIRPLLDCGRAILVICLRLIRGILRPVTIFGQGALSVRAGLRRGNSGFSKRA
jgi:hypothetical protein